MLCANTVESTHDAADFGLSGVSSWGSCSALYTGERLCLVLLLRLPLRAWMHDLPVRRDRSLPACAFIALQLLGPGAEGRADAVILER